MFIDRATCLVVALAITSGCASTNTNGYSQLQSAYALSAQKRTPRGELTFDGPVLDRPSFVKAVLDANPSIEAARQGWRGALARVRQAGAFEDPMVDLGMAPLSIGSSSARFGWQASISQKLPWFGKRSFEGAVALAEANARRSDFEAARRDLALAASVLYDDYFVAVRSIEINAHHVELLRVLRAAATAQLETGRASLHDTLQAEAELTHLEHDAVVLGVNRDVAVAQMNELLHRDPQLALPPPKDLAAPSPEVVDEKHLATEAIDRRPEIEAARERARAEAAKASRAERESWPDVNVSTSYNTMWDMPEHRWMVGLGFNLPIQTGRRAGAVEEANAERARHESDVLRMTDAARTEVAVARMRVEESRHVIKLLETRLLPVARDQIAAARVAFVSSQAPFGAVIEAERNLRHVELEYAMARAEEDKRGAQLERALGRIPGGAR